MEELKEVEKLKKIAKGLPASPGMTSGIVRNIRSIKEISKVKEGDILVTIMTNRDMVPAMRKASAVVTDEGGNTCHAAIVARELEIPCVVGTQGASKVLEEGIEVTVNATKGLVYEGIILGDEFFDK